MDFYENYDLMRKQNHFSKLFLIRFAVIFALGLLPLSSSHSCGFSDTSFHGYSFLNFEIVDEKSSSAHSFVKIVSFDDIYKSDFQKDSLYQTTCDDENLLEWRQKFCEYADIQDVRQVIYKSSLEDLESIRNATQSNEVQVNDLFLKNEFAQQIIENKCMEVCNYLVFAKQCEPFVLQGDAWNTKIKDMKVISEKVEEGKKLFNATKSPFLRLRYAFQVMRLSHYSGYYQTTVNQYNYFLPKIDNRVRSVVQYWVLSLKAGALKQLGQRVEASYLFSIVFEHCLSKRQAAMRGFSIQTDYEWQQCLSLCQNDDEKISLYAMRGSHNDAKAVEEMQLIYDLNPKNPHIENLLLREIRKLERDLLGYGFNDHKEENRRFAGLPRQYAGEYAIRLHQFVLKCIKQNRVARPELWQVADGYLELLRGDHYAAVRVFDKIKDGLKNEAMREQVEVLSMAAQIHSFERLDTETEEKISEIMKNPLYKKYKDLPDFLFDKLTDFYKKNGRKGCAYRCHHRLDAMKPNPQMDIIDDLLLLCQKNGKSDLERYFCSDEKGNSLEDELWEMKGVFLLSQNQLEASLEAFKKVSNARLEKQKFNPFGLRIKECVHCPAKDSSKFLNRREIVEKLIDYEYQAKADLQEGYKYLFKSGVAYYNMSYYGTSWGAMDFYRTGSAWCTSENKYDNEYVTYYYPYGNREQTDLSLAYERLTAAYDLARTRDRDFAAKCAFWAGKCQQKMYYTSKDFRQTAYGNMPKIPYEYRTYLGALKELSDTPYYQEVIKECSYFKRM
jgi:hypothetical protein